MNRELILLCARRTILLGGTAAIIAWVAMACSDSDLPDDSRNFIVNVLSGLLVVDIVVATWLAVKVERIMVLRVLGIVIHASMVLFIAYCAWYAVNRAD